MLESGFYKRDGDELLHGPNFVEGPTFLLLRDNYTEYNYPVDGWSWYENENQARTILGLDLTQE